jgi:hypothetical protein
MEDLVTPLTLNRTRPRRLFPLRYWCLRQTHLHALVRSCDRDEISFTVGSVVQGDQKVSMHLMITVQNTQKYFKQFQSLTVITCLELGMTDGVSVSLVSPWPWWSAAKLSN